MVKIDELIKALEELKTDLNKNVNMSYSGTQPNMSGTPQMTQKAEAGKDAKVLISNKPISTDEVEDAGAAGFKVAPKRGQKMTQLDIKKPIEKEEDCIKYDAKGQWSINTKKFNVDGSLSVKRKSLLGQT